QPLPVDSSGPVVKVLIARGRVATTNPPQILAQVKINNSGTSINSLIINETLPVDWSAFFTQAVQVFFRYQNSSLQEITGMLTIKLSYSLKGSVVSPRLYPVTYTNLVNVKGYSENGFSGESFDKNATAGFTAKAKVVGDVDGDFDVDLNDWMSFTAAYGTSSG